MKTLRGIPASPGITIGKALLYNESSTAIPRFHVPEEEVPNEVERLKKAVVKAAEEIQLIKESLDKDASEQHALLEAHTLMLYDPCFNELAHERVAKELKNVEWVLQETVNNLVEQLEATQDSYLRERSSDILDSSRRIIDHLLCRKRVTLGQLDKEVILVAHNILATELLQLDRRKLLGVIMDGGGKTSHTAILARSFGLPCVVGLKSITEEARSEVTLIVDAIEGLVIVDPDEQTLELYRKKRALYEKKEAQLFNITDLPAETIDGKLISLKANIEFPAETDHVLNMNAEGVGLFRSEFLFLEQWDASDDEDAQYHTYREVLEMMGNRPVTIRTLDVGGDKLISEIESQHEANPLLGWRAIRFCLEKTDIFRTQIRALLRASHHGKMRIMFPMISGIEEFEEALRIVEDVKAELKMRNIPYDDSVPVGLMIEVPSAALTSDILAEKADFLSIGTNDLIQYSIAIDRGNEKVASMYQPLHPGLIRLIHMVVQNAHKHGIPVSLCGEMGGEPMYTAILLGLGLDEISMSAYSLPEIKKIIRSVSIAESEELLGTILEMRSYKEINDFTRLWMEKRFEDK
ncbi:MAG: phosphoenolpyruvate--protein phosphotransferase [Spirochaetales bacterium]|nr:phosphoenolpyruvate--protein phosphotransferase [Spirochaetales bacterium]